MNTTSELPMAPRDNVCGARCDDEGERPSGSRCTREEIHPKQSQTDVSRVQLRELRARLLRLIVKNEQARRKCR